MEANFPNNSEGEWDCNINGHQFNSFLNNYSFLSTTLTCRRCDKIWHIVEVTENQTPSGASGVSDLIVP